MDISSSPAPPAAGPVPTAVPAKAPKAPPSALAQAAQAYAVTLLETQLPAQLTYHTLRHTATVAKEARALAVGAGLSPADTEALLVAAWFHDTGYLDAYDGHEYRSMERAAAWLATQNVPADRIRLVQDLIRATHRDEPADTELQKLLVDADMSNLAL